MDKCLTAKFSEQRIEKSMRWAICPVMGLGEFCSF